MLLYNLMIVFLFLLVGKDRIEELNQCDAPLCSNVYDPHLLIVLRWSNCLLLASYFKKLCYILSAMKSFFALAVTKSLSCLSAICFVSSWIRRLRIVLSGFFHGCHHHGFHISGDQWIKKCQTHQCLTQVPDVAWETLYSCFSNRCVDYFVCHQLLEQLQIISQCLCGTLARVPSLQVHLHHKYVELLQTCKLTDSEVKLRAE